MYTHTHTNIHTNTHTNTLYAYIHTQTHAHTHTTHTHTHTHATGFLFFLRPVVLWRSAAQLWKHPLDSDTPPLLPASLVSPLHSPPAFFLFFISSRFWYASSIASLPCLFASLSVCICLYVSRRQHTTAYVGIRQHNASSIALPASLVSLLHPHACILFCFISSKSLFFKSLFEVPSQSSIVSLPRLSTSLSSAWIFFFIYFYLFFLYFSSQSTFFFFSFVVNLSASERLAECLNLVLLVRSKRSP